MEDTLFIRAGPPPGDVSIQWYYNLQEGTRGIIYVTTKALDGFFLVLGREEKKIRTDPAARVTDLLRDVFGGK
jgi:hypothetical protein